MPSSGDNIYSSFKNDLIIGVRSLKSPDLQSLIEEFDEVINSRRRSSSIQNVSDLISVLEKRAHISSDNIFPLCKIVDRLPNQEEKDRMLARLYQDRHTSNVMSTNTNVGERQPPSCTGIDPARYSSQRNRYEMNYHPPILPNEVVEHISEEIGNKWRDLARKLKLREGEINDINMANRNNPKQCAYQCLMKYQSKSVHNELEKNLLSALEKVRRNDLRNHVQKMLNR